MMRPALLPVAGAAAGLLCAIVAQGQPPRANPEFGFSDWREKCEAQPLGLSPEAWTRRDDAQRIVGGRYVEPVPLRCVLGSYREGELKRAAERGDPVAHLAIGYELLTDSEQPCERLAAIERELNAAARPLRSAYEMPLVVGSAPVARVPEAALLLGQVYAACGRADEARLMVRKAWDLGLDTRSAEAEVRDL